MSGAENAPGYLGEDELYAAALCSLGATPFVVARWLAGRSPRQAWEELARGEHPKDPKQRARTKATARRLELIGSACSQAGVAVLIKGKPGYPDELADDIAAPPVLFALGDPKCLYGYPRVTIVGTKAATSYGRSVAAEIGEALARREVAVISGLARGIDSAAHAGALRAEAGGPLAAVLATSLSDPLSPPQMDLRRQVLERGALFGELPPGAAPARWSFAVRNRIMAAFSHVVVVVESHARGGSLHTVEAARERDIPVMAVPGSIRSPASAGTNALLADGALVVRDAQDVVSCLEQAIVHDSSVKPPSVDRPRRHNTRRSRGSASFAPASGDFSGRGASRTTRRSDERGV